MAVNDDVQQFLDDVPSDDRPIVDRARTVILESYPDARETVKWNKLTYVVDGADRFYVDVTAECVALGFIEATGLEDPEDLLVGADENMRHVELRDVDDAEDPAVRSLVEEAGMDRPV